MPKKLPIFLSIVLLSAATLACVQSANIPPTLDPNAASTAIAATINAIQTLSSPTQSPVPSPTLDASTATPIVSPTTEGTEAAALPAVYVTVSVDTWCRLGPGAEYEKAGILLVGEIGEVLGRDAFGQFWYIRNPDIGVEFCWISAEYATVEGNVLSIVAQPPPADLSSDVELTYTGLGKCSNSNTWWVDMRISNQSNISFNSINLIAGDGATNIFRSMNSNGFPFTDGCASPTSEDTLNPGSSVRISSPEFTYDLNGADISVSLTICTEINMGGTCVSKTLAFVP